MKLVTIDTNLFISGFSNSPNEYDTFAAILNDLGIKVIVPQYVLKEMRWYMRRSIEPHLVDYFVNEKKLIEFEGFAKTHFSKLPQRPDMAVIYVAHKKKCPVVSSDLRLIQVSEALKQDTFMNSAFILYLQNKVTKPEQKAYLQSLYEKLFAEEISYSVEGKNIYDPVKRIQKIMESAINVVSSFSSPAEGVKLKTVDKAMLNTLSSKELDRFTKWVRADLSVYITEFQNGHYDKLEMELIAAVNQLTDLILDYQLEGGQISSELAQNALTTMGHVLFLLVYVELIMGDLKNADEFLNHLAIVLFESKEAAKTLDKEFHQLRIVILLLSKQFQRLATYFTTQFLFSEEGKDKSSFLANLSIISAVLSSCHVEKKAKVKSYDDIEYTQQLGMQFAAINEFKEAMLLLEQVFYFALNDKMIGLAVFAIEAMIPICFIDPIYFKDIKRLHKELLKKDKAKSVFLNLEKRIAPIARVSSKILAKEPTKKDELDPSLQGWLDVLTVETIILKSGSALYVKTMVQIEDQIYRIGLLDREHILPEKMPIGSSVQLIDGYYTVIRPKKEVREQKEIDLLIRVIPRSNARILYRRVSGISMASSQEKLMKYDLPDTEDERP
jgi:hypothetical protein